MKVMKSLRVVALAGLVALPAGVAAAQDQDKSLTTSEEVRAKVSQAMDAIADYSAQERDQAVAAARVQLVCCGFGCIGRLQFRAARDDRRDLCEPRRVPAVAGREPTHAFAGDAGEALRS